MSVVERQEPKDVPSLLAHAEVPECQVLVRFSLANSGESVLFKGGHTFQSEMVPLASHSARFTREAAEFTASVHHLEEGNTSALKSIAHTTRQPTGRTR